MSPNCETPTSSLSTSLRFVPSLACIAEEEPKVIGIRKITVPGSSKPFQVQIPLYDLNIYAPEPPKQPLPDSYQRLLAEMDQYIGGHQNSEMYKEMAKNLRHKVAVEQAENNRLSKSNFTNRDWYWYAEQTRAFVDEPVINSTSKTQESNISECLEETSSSAKSTVMKDEDLFDLSADF
ncbi:Carn_acyltransf domain-containing protein [Caenorhabditis elegans]|uniref:Carn_acyltransf domain-containing protein n=1 Tax=Caenorhabditis elegans TaxID=6239 RepID=Q18959_CAEEL|nr:Carn_acyltransf domain-containing protein [Caenorhabditis elegans]CAB00027.1 Carn_acyltransf domain-containing protein [Caenorhabditis elegans]|eukprot:NP_492300.1 Uncharacterized protein CELE_D1081.6 [Caenorhabditis elegans]